MAMAQLDFSQIYAEHKERVWRIISRYVSSRHDKEDLFQEVFLNVHKALPRFREGARPETWIYRIAVNTSINYLKKQKRYRKLKETLSRMGLVAKETNEISAEGLIFEPLEKLNPQQRTILIMADVEEEKLDEIAGILKIPVGTVKSSLHRAREIVRKELKKYG